MIFTATSSLGKRRGSTSRMAVGKRNTTPTGSTISGSTITSARSLSNIDDGSKRLSVVSVYVCLYVCAHACPCLCLQKATILFSTEYNEYDPLCNASYLR